jgi:hypothetical protein
METNFDVVCYLNGQEIEETKKFSSLKFGKNLAERTCIVCIYDKNWSNFKPRFSQLLARHDWGTMATSCIESLLDHYAAICNFTREVFGKDYADLVNSERAPHAPAVPTVKSSETFSAKKTEEEASKETVNNTRESDLEFYKRLLHERQAARVAAMCH